jgi:Flp pilus assembly protein TadG
MTRGLWSRHATVDRGSSAVEFALVLPLLIVILFGIVDVGRLEFERINVTAAAYEGARASGYKLGATAVTNAVNAASGGLAVSVTSSTNLNCVTAGAETTVTVSRPTAFRFYTPFLQAFQTTVTATGAFRCTG